MTGVGYDEFALLAENAEEAGLPWEGPPAVRRVWVPVADGRRISALVWGTASPETVFLHGGSQNAHTWDTVLLALGRPALAVDLPDHGHSDWRADGPRDVRAGALDVAVAIRALAPTATAVVGMSLGGLTAIALGAQAPELVSRLVLVDITPAVSREQSAPIRAFVDGPESFASIDEILERTIEHNPTRSFASLRRGVLHNARRREDGRWVWRYRRPPANEISARPELWDDVAAITGPIMLVRGTERGTCVDDAAVARLRQLQPTVQVHAVEGAGHSIQGDRPLELVRHLQEFLPR